MLVEDVDSRPLVFLYMRSTIPFLCFFAWPSLSLDYARISQSLILPCSFATANMLESGANATAVMRPKGVAPVGQFLYTVQEGR